MVQPVIVFVTSPINIADLIATTLVSEHLAACVNIVPTIKSVFFWQGKVEDQSESLLLIKSTKACLKALEKRIKDIHTYDMPEIVWVKIEDGYKPYIDWINLTVKASNL